jgi:hypothetical protein
LLSWMASSAPPISLDGKPIPVLVATPSPKPTRSALPILVVLFVISYSLMILLVFEQARTIESQRGLIRSLFQDSTQLSRMKIQANQTQQAAAQAQAQAEAAERSQVKTPSTQDKKQDLSKAGPSAGRHKQVLPKPDIEDLSLEHARRVVITI